MNSNEVYDEFFRIIDIEWSEDDQAYMEHEARNSLPESIGGYIPDDEYGGA